MIVTLSSPHKKITVDNVEKIFLPTLAGEIEVLTDHMPLLSELTQGEIRLQTEDGHDTSYLVSRGYARIINNQIDLLLDEADSPEGLVKEEIEAAIADAQKMIESRELPPTELIQLEKRLRYERFKLKYVEI